MIERGHTNGCNDSRRGLIGCMRSDFKKLSNGRFSRILTIAALNLALRPNHPECASAGTAMARWFLYVRSHYLRMPVHILVPHLVRKAYMGRFPEQGPRPAVHRDPAG